MYSHDTQLSVLNNTDIVLQEFDFVGIKNSILGKKYDLSLAFVKPSEMRKASIVSGHKIKEKEVPNVLSFTLSKNSGEILICPSEAKKESKKFNRTPEKHIAMLFIHGLYHLKGLDHGVIMERKENNTEKLFGI